MFVGRMCVVFYQLCLGLGLCRLQIARDLSQLFSRAFRYQKRWRCSLQCMVSGLLVWRVLFLKIAVEMFLYSRHWVAGVTGFLHSSQLVRRLFLLRIAGRQGDEVSVQPGVCKLMFRIQLVFLVVNHHLFVPWFGR